MTRGERGSGSVLMLLGVVLLAPAVVAGLTLTHLLVAHRQVAAAADLTALAAAQALLAGAEPCGAAADLAALNRVRVTGCVVDAERVTVSVEAEVGIPFGLTVPVRVAATAGPSSLGSAPIRRNRQDSSLSP